MRRREFIKVAAMAGAAYSANRTALAADGPIVVSTWRTGLAANRRAAETIEGGGSALDAAEAGVREVETDPSDTSVGLGGLPNREGDVELDASIMNGETLDVGSVAGIRDILHPVSVARRVMERTPHVMLVGRGARRFALEQGFRKQTLLTSEARRAYRRWKSEGGEGGNHDTIGTIVADGSGALAGAASTSGVAFKLPGRVGDTPLIGHGLYCDASAGGAAATGLGEEVIRVCGSYQVVEFMRQGLPATEAIRRVLHRILDRRRSGPPPSVAFVALRADGDVGFGSILPGFEAAVTRNRRHDLEQVPSLISPGPA